MLGSNLSKGVIVQDRQGGEQIAPRIVTERWPNMSQAFGTISGTWRLVGFRGIHKCWFWNCRLTLGHTRVVVGATPQDQRAQHSHRIFSSADAGCWLAATVYYWSAHPIHYTTHTYTYTHIDAYWTWIKVLGWGYPHIQVSSYVFLLQL